MDTEGILIGFSQLGAVFAGFIAIFLVFARKDGRFSPADSLRIRSIVHVTMVLVIGALLPLSLSLYGLSDQKLWKMSAIILLFFGFSATLNVARYHIGMGKEDRRDVGLLHSLVSWVMNFAVATLLILIAVGFSEFGFASQFAANYVLALFLMLAIVMSNFVTLSLQKLL
jgi:hypothetical protein